MSESATLDAATVKDVLDQVNSQPIETLNVAQSALFQTETMWPYFDRLRAEDPVHWTPASDFEPIILRGKPIHIVDIYAPGVPPMLRDIAEQLQAGPYSQLIVPMAWEGRAIGLISVIRHPPEGKQRITAKGSFYKTLGGNHQYSSRSPPWLCAARIRAAFASPWRCGVPRRAAHCDNYGTA